MAIAMATATATATATAAAMAMAMAMALAMALAMANTFVIPPNYTRLCSTLTLITHLRQVGIAHSFVF